MKEVENSKYDYRALECTLSFFLIEEKRRGEKTSRGVKVQREEATSQ